MGYESSIGTAFVARYGPDSLAHLRELAPKPLSLGQQLDQILNIIGRQNNWPQFSEFKDPQAANQPGFTGK